MNKPIHSSGDTLGPRRGALLSEAHITLLEELYFNHPAPLIFHAAAVQSLAIQAHVCL